jgi:RNA polymerase sigma factor (TIGR02999 family)
MPSAPQDDITQLLNAAAAGDATSGDRLYQALYRELTRLARSHLSRVGTISLDASTLMHEAYLRFGGAVPDIAFPNRKVFFGYASSVMRNVILDHVRERRAEKRGGGQRDLTLNTTLADALLNEDNLEDLNDALQALDRIDTRCRQVVDLRFFGGLSEDEVAAALEISVPTVKRDWRKARAFLYQQLSA